MPKTKQEELEEFEKRCKKYGLSTNCTESDVVRVRRQLGFEHHPDRKQDKTEKLVADEKLALINDDCDKLIKFISQVREFQCLKRQQAAQDRAAQERQEAQARQAERLRRERNKVRFEREASEREAETKRRSENEANARNKYSVVFNKYFVDYPELANLNDPEFAAVYNQYFQLCLKNNIAIDIAEVVWARKFNEYKERVKRQVREREQERIRRAEEREAQEQETAYKRLENAYRKHLNLCQYSDSELYDDKFLQLFENHVLWCCLSPSRPSVEEAKRVWAAIYKKYQRR